MSVLSQLKKVVEKVPYPLGRFIALVPFSLRLGKAYQKSRLEIKQTGAADARNYVLTHFAKIFEAAKQHPFYQELYTKAGVMDLEVSSLEDIDKVPIITKQMLRSHVDEFSGAYKINTGGTSGEPFSFYVDTNAWAREWAHMHEIWSKRGYDYKDLKITLRGKNLGEAGFIYNPVHNEFVINTYKPVSSFASEIVNLFKQYPIKFVHGYPSAVYNFFKELEVKISAEDKQLISDKIMSCLLGSEFPHPRFVDYLKEVWGLNYISWFGHSEMCILAYDEYSKNHYKPFVTYGFTEVVDGHLIGTSYHNFDMPLVRYDTGDLVTPTYDEEGLLESFSVEQGRVGDFITDRHGRQIPLTAFIFGRHHKAFDVAEFVQISQDIADGVVTLLLTYPGYNGENLFDLFDLSQVDQAFEFKVLEKPIRSKAGKFKLKVNMDEISL